MASFKHDSQNISVDLFLSLRLVLECRSRQIVKGLVSKGIVVHRRWELKDEILVSNELTRVKLPP